MGIHITHISANVVSVEHRPEQIRKTYPIQETTTDDLASDIAQIGPKKLLKWVRQGIRPSAPTPLDFEAKEKGFETSNYILHLASSTYAI